MHQSNVKIVANSNVQYMKCQGFLKGDVDLLAMYPLLVVYYNEIDKLYQSLGKSVSADTDREVATTFCKNILPPANV